MAASAGAFLARRDLFFGFFLGNRLEEVVDEGDGSIFLVGLGRRGFGLFSQLIVGGFDEVEQHFSVAEIDGGLAQFGVESGIVEQVEVLQHQKPRRLVIGMEREQAAKLVESLAVHLFGVVDELRQVHFPIFFYQFATVALKIWSVSSFTICVTSSSCTALSDCVDS